MKIDLFAENTIKQRLKKAGFLDSDFILESFDTHKEGIHFLICIKINVGETNIYYQNIGKEANKLFNVMIEEIHKYKEFYNQPKHDFNEIKIRDWFITQYENKYYFEHNEHTSVFQEVLENEAECLIDEYKNTKDILQAFFETEIDLVRNDEWR